MLPYASYNIHENSYEKLREKTGVNLTVCSSHLIIETVLSDTSVERWVCAL